MTARAEDENVAGPSGSENTTRQSMEEEKNILKSQYRELIELMDKREDEVLENTVEDGEDIFQQVAEKANVLFSSVKHADEAVLDAKVLKNLSRICRRQAEGFSTNVQTFRAAEYADKLVNFMQGRREEDGTQERVTINPKRWILFGQVVKSMYARAPSLNYVYGSLAPEQTVKKQRHRRAKVTVDERDLIVTKSTHLKEPVKSENQTEVLVQATYKQLVEEYIRLGKQAFGYFHFVVHPDSFGATVENIFHVSFLVKEGKAKISYDEETGLPVIEPLKRRDVASDADGRPPDKKQVVMNISMQDWMELKSALHIRKAMINHEDLIDQRDA